MAVRGGKGGVPPLTRPERAIARADALKTLKAEHFPTVVFTTDRVEAVDRRGLG